MSYQMVCIIILNWNGYEITRECLHSLKEIDYPAFKIVMIDNGSNDGSVAKLKTEFDDRFMDIISLEKNTGFTGGNNIGIKHAKDKYDPDYFLMLNNDTVVKKDFLTKMVNSFKEDEKCYAAVPKIFYFEPSDKLWFAGGKISRLTGIVTHFGLDSNAEDRYNIGGQTYFMNGCCALISKESITEVGILDDRFFANSEDADYSLRVLNSGHTIQYVPTAVIFHKVSHAFKSNFGKWLAFYLAARNIVQLQKKHLPAWQMPVFYTVFGLRWVLYLTVKLFIIGDFKSIKAIYQGVVDGTTNKLRFVNKDSVN